VTPAGVEKLYSSLGATQRADVLLGTFKEEAIRSLHDLQSQNLKGLLRRTIGRIFNDVEIKGWCKEQEQKNSAARLAEIAPPEPVAASA
jgi:hypothetical protein